jgi:pectate lyase
MVHPIKILLCGLASLGAAFPLGSFGLASWDVEGYAKDNPLGPTTGGKGGPSVTVENAADLKAAVAGDDPKIILVKGEIQLSARLKVGSNKSLIGVRDTAHITGFGIDVFNATNVVLRNMKISFINGNDCITIRNSTRVWVDHNEFTSDITKGPDFYVRLLPGQPAFHFQVAMLTRLPTYLGRTSGYHPGLRLDHRFMELLPRSLEVVSCGK